MLKTQHPTDYLKKNEEVAEPIEEEQYTQQGEGSFQHKHRVRRQYNPDDTNIVELFAAIRKHKTGNPPKDKTSKIETLLAQIQNINDIDLNDNSNTPLHVAL